MVKEYILNLIIEKKFQILKEALGNINENDICTIFTELSDENILIIFRLLPKYKAAEVFSNMDHSMKKILINSFTYLNLFSKIDSSILLLPFAIANVQANWGCISVGNPG